TPLEQAVEEAKDAVVEASAEESRLHNTAEALGRRHEELEGRRRKLEDEQRFLGERLRTNAHDAEGASEMIIRLEDERVGLRTDRDGLAQQQLNLGREEAVRSAALDAAREAARRAAVIAPAGRRLPDQIDIDPQHWALAEALLGQVLLADDLGHALALWRAASHPVTVVTPGGEAIDAVGAVTGGSEPPL